MANIGNPPFEGGIGHDYDASTGTLSWKLGFGPCQEILGMFYINVVKAKAAA